MALQGFAWGIAVMIALFLKGGDSQPACAKPPINSRIIGGQDAPPGRWPWHVTFTYNYYFGNYYFGNYPICQGSLITDEWVLTAAQCLIDYNTYFGIVLHFGATNQFQFGEVTRTIANVHCHQNYTYPAKNDICLVKLSAPVNFTDYIRPVCLAAENSTFYDGTSSWVTGLSYSGSYSFQEVNVSVVGNRKCNCIYNYYYYSYYNTITEDLMCAGSEDSSYQDEGAALVTKKDSIWVQSGIVSVNFQGYSVYTRVSQYQKWITDRVTGMEPGFVTYTSPGIDSDLNYTCPPPPTTTPYPYFTTWYPYSTTWYPYFTTWYPYFTTRYPYVTTPYPYVTTRYPYVTTPYPYVTTQHPTTDGSIFGRGETLIPIARVFPLSALVLFVHLFVGRAGN